MRSLIILFSAYFCIHLTYNVIDGESKDNALKYMSLAIEASMVLLGGILLTFVVRPRTLFLFSIISFIIGFIFYLCPKKENKFIMYMIYIWVSMAYGIFKFMFIVIILDQQPEGYLTFKLGMWCIVQNMAYLCYFTAEKYLLSPILIGVGFLVSVILVYGVLSKTIKIKSKLINIVISVRKISQSKNTLTVEDKQVIVSLSKSVIIWFLLIAYGMCQTQIIYSYSYQSRCLAHPNLGNNVIDANNLPAIMDTASTILIMTVILVLYYRNVCGFQSFYKNMSFKVIFGNILMILSVFYCAALETVRLNLHSSTPVSNLTTEGSESEISTFYVWWMIPYILFGTISGILVIITCYEYIYLHSTEYNKYMSNAFISSIICTGCIPDVVFMVLNKEYLQEESCFPKRRKLNSGYISKFEYLIYSLGGLATLSLIVSIFIMKRFKKYFTTANHYQSLSELCH